jgi:hypothetical protein
MGFGEPSRRPPSIVACSPAVEARDVQTVGPRPSRARVRSGRTR